MSDTKQLGEMKVGKFSFKIAEPHPEAGKKIEKAFEYQELTSEVDAQLVMDEKKWKLLDLVNDNLKSNARANAYQNETAKYKPANKTPDEAMEAMIRQGVQQGGNEDVVRARITAMFAELGIS